MALLLACGVRLPFLFRCAMIGFVVYAHHTHTAVHWHAERAAWVRAEAFVSSTVHVRAHPVEAFSLETAVGRARVCRHGLAWPGATTRLADASKEEQHR